MVITIIVIIIIIISSSSSSSSGSSIVIDIVISIIVMIVIIVSISISIIIIISRLLEVWCINYCRTNTPSELTARPASLGHAGAEATRSELRMASCRDAHVHPGSRMSISTRLHEEQGSASSTCVCPFFSPPPIPNLANNMWQPPPFCPFGSRAQISGVHKEGHRTTGHSVET